MNDPAVIDRLRRDLTAIRDGLIAPKPRQCWRTMATLDNAR
jgi:hypothetical protein